MKYNICINQKSIIESGLNLDLVDCAILDFIKDFTHCKDCVTAYIDDKIYYWISHSIIIDNMPLVGIKTKDGIIKRMKTLVEKGILGKYENCQDKGRTFYCFDKNYDKLFFADFEQNYLQHSHIEDNKTLLTPSIQSYRPLYSRIDPSIQPYRPPLYGRIDYNNIIYNNNKYNNIIISEKKIKNEISLFEEENFKKIKLGEKEKKSNWRNDFEIYLSDVKKIYEELINDKSFIETHEKYNSNLDVRLTLEKSFTLFWGTKEGWEWKKKGKSNLINWKSTLTKSISQSQNKVYKPFLNSQEALNQNVNMRKIKKDIF